MTLPSATDSDLSISKTEQGESLPLVSVAIPAYNHAAFIEACLASVCAQTYPELELVLIDDGSSDATFELAQSFLSAHQSRFRRIVLEKRKNQGVSANSNACIEACQGEWVHLLGSDDTIYPNKVERIQASIKEWNCPELALVFASSDQINSEGKKVIGRPAKESLLAPGLNFHTTRTVFLGKSGISNPTLALHRKKLLAIGGFDPQLVLEDFDFWLRLSIHHAFARLPEILASYRKHPGNSLRQRTKMLSGGLVTCAKFLESGGGVDEKALRQHFRQSVWCCWRRVRSQAPWLFPALFWAMVYSLWHTPEAKDYRHLATFLDAHRRAARW